MSKAKEKSEIYFGKTPNEKLDLLKANCKTAEKQQVKVFFSEDDLAEMKSRLSESSIERNNLEDELSDIGKGLRGKIKSETKTIKNLLLYLKNKYEYQEQEVFDFDDQESGMMLTYNCQGDLINSRKLRPNERQTSIIDFKSKTA
jgi:hypothetical protein